MKPCRYYLKYKYTQNPGEFTWQWTKKRDFEELEKSQIFNSYQECFDSYRAHKGTEQCLQEEVDPHTIYEYSIPDVGGGVFVVDRDIGRSKDNLTYVELAILRQIIERHKIKVFKDGEPIDHYSLVEERYNPSPFSITIIPGYGSLPFILSGNFGYQK